MTESAGPKMVQREREREREKKESKTVLSAIFKVKKNWRTPIIRNEAASGYSLLGFF